MKIYKYTEYQDDKNENGREIFKFIKKRRFLGLAG